MNPSLKHILNLSAASGLIYFVLSAVFYFIGLDPLGNVKMLLFFIPVYTIYKGMKDYRDKFNDGELTYGKGFRTGVTIGFFYAAFIALTFYLFAVTIATDMFEIHQQYMLEQLEQADKVYGGSSFIEMAIEEISKSTLATVMWGEFQSKLFGAAIISLIVAAILKKEKPLFDTLDSNE